MKSGFARMLDYFVLSTAIWLFFFIVLRYFLSGFVEVLASATVFTFATMFLLRLKGSKADESGYMGAKIAEYFMLKSEFFALKYFFDALKKQYSQAELICNKTNNQPDSGEKKINSQSDVGDYIKINNTLIFVQMSGELSLKTTVKMHQFGIDNNAKVVVILCVATQKNVSLALERLNGLRLEIFQPQKIYKLLKSLNSLPQFEKISIGKKFGAFLTSAIKPDRSRGYLLTSITLLFGAYFSQFWLYFLVFGSICLSLALVSRLGLLSKHS